MSGTFLRDKKGSISDLLLVGMILLVLGVTILIGFKVTSEFNSRIQTMDVIPADAKAISATVTGKYPSVIDNTFLFLAIGLALAAIVLASLVRVHPIFIPFYFIALLLVIFFCGIFSNIYQGMADSTALASTASQLTFTTHVMVYLPFIIGIFGTLLMVAMYKLWSNEQL